MDIVIATLETRNYTFTVVALTEAVATQRLKNAWQAHRRQTGATLRWADVEDGVNYHRTKLGKVVTT